MRPGSGQARPARAAEVPRPARKKEGEYTRRRRDAGARRLGDPAKVRQALFFKNLQPTPFGERHRFLVADDQVIQHPDIEQTERGA